MKTAAISLAVVSTGCNSLSGGGSGGASSGSAINLAGSLSLSSTSQSFKVMSARHNPLASLGKVTDDYISAQSVDLTAYSVTCVTTTTPIKTGTSAVSADGSFAVDIEGGANQPLSCFLVDADGTRQADFIIADTANKDLNGASQVSGTATFAQSAAMGAVTFDPNSGEVTVPKSNISSALADDAPSTTTVFDPTGSWSIGAVDFTLPSGVKGPCAGGGGGGGDHSCNGPPEGQEIYLKFWKGIKTSDSSNVYGLQVWNSPTQFSACGSKIGLTSTIKSSIGVDFSQNGASDSTFTFASSVANFHDDVSSSTGTVNLTDNWKMDTATAQWDINPNCGPRDITIAGVTYSNAWVCGEDNAGLYQAQLGGGCQDSSGNPVQLQNWSGISCGSMTIDSSGIRTISCSGTASINSVSKAVICTNKWAVTNSSYAVQTSAGVNFTWNDLNLSKVSSGTLCSAIPTGIEESGKIAQLQCYANYFDRSGLRESSACLPGVDTDWSSTSAANFIKVDLIRPGGLVFFEQFKPFPDGSGGTMVTRQEHYNGVQVNGNSWVNCRVIETGGLTIKKLSDNKLLATYQQSTVTTSLSKPACMAAFTGARETFMFYLTK